MKWDKLLIRDFFTNGNFQACIRRTYEGVCTRRTYEGVLHKILLDHQTIILVVQNLRVLCQISSYYIIILHALQRA